MATILKDWQMSIFSVNDLFTNLGMEAEIDWNHANNQFIQLSSLQIEGQMIYWIKNDLNRAESTDLVRAKYRYDIILKNKYGLLTDLNRWVIRDKSTLMIIETPQNIIFTHNRLASYEQNISGLIC